MQFNSITFAIFFTLVFLLNYYLPQRFRWILLLASSIVFYSFLRAPHLILIFSVVCFTSWYAALKISNNVNKNAKSIIFVIAIIINVLILVLSKSLSNIIMYVIYNNEICLPQYVSNDIAVIGISFYIFQAISYVTDVYLDIQDPELHLGYFALYLCFFPKLFQGPIEKASEFIPQLHQPYRFDYDNVKLGLVLFGWGLFKKIVVADRLAVFVNGIYGDVHEYWGIQFVIAMWIYSLQIYCDFSGYTDMALGLGQTFNIKLSPNFANPYSARSIPEFWRRWHISLSRWLMDYVFKPLNMALRDYSWIGTPFALMITFLICGVWHGFTLGFLAWGALHGFYMVTAYILAKYKIQLPSNRFFNTIKILVTFNLVSFAWIFFRANSINDALYIVKMLPVNLGQDIINVLYHGLITKDLKLGTEYWPRLHIYLIVLIAYFIFNKFFSNPSALVLKKYRWGIYLFLTASIVLLKAEKLDFVYGAF